VRALQTGQPRWLAWVHAAKRGDGAAREELAQFVTPFVHGVLVCRLSTRAANMVLPPLLGELLARLVEQESAPRTRGPWLVSEVRRRAVELALDPALTPEAAGAGSGEAVLGEIRSLPEPARERLMLRVLEGISGPEIAELSGADEVEVRGDLERAMAAVHEGGAFLGDAYLWCSRGAPHPMVVRLENQLSGLRYDPTSTSGLAPRVSPPAGPEADATTPHGTGLRDAEPETAPFVPQMEDPTAPRAAALLLEQPATVRVARVSASANPFAALAKTAVAADLPAAAVVNPFSALPATALAKDLPAAAVNPFAALPPTALARDLPAAAQANAPTGLSKTAPASNLTGLSKTAPASNLPAAAAPVTPKVALAPAAVTRTAAPAPFLTRNERAPSGESPSPFTASRVRPLDPLSAPDVAAVPQPEELDATALRVPALPHPPPVEETVPRGVPVSMLVDSWRQPEGPISVDVELTAPPRPAPALAHPPQTEPAPYAVARGGFPFAVAAVLLLLCGVTGFLAVRGEERQVRRGWALVPVAVAAANIPEGSVVTFDMISSRDVPEMFVTSSVVKPESVRFITDQRILVPVQAGDPLLWSEFETSLSTERLSTRVQRRGRAFTIDADEISSVGGWIRPGDHVDVIVSLGDHENVHRFAATTLQNLIVLATGNATARTSDALAAAQREYSTVSVLALPEEIEVLALMRAKAHYQLVLRNPEDLDSGQTRRASQAMVLTPENGALVRKTAGQAHALVATRPASPKEKAPAHYAPWVNLNPGGVRTDPRFNKPAPRR
jgi:pilus assembly protein CpaB